MKRTIAIFMAALTLTTMLTACGASMGIDTGRGNGNVSTTPNGTVNGGTYDNTMPGNYGRNMMPRSYSRNDMTGTNPSSGTGMTGGR